MEKEKLKNLLKGNNHSKEELELIIDFFLNNKKYKETSSENREILEKKKQLEEIYIKLIKKEQEKISEYQDIKKMIVMISYAEILEIENILFELPIEKSMRIFPNLNTFYFLYTSGTEEDFIHIKEKVEKIFKKNPKEVEIIGKKVENTLESIYPYLKELVREGKISKNDTILDLTTGMKISGIALYKLAVERGIKIINWKEEFLALPKKEDGKFGGSVRIPFSVCLEILKEPIRESSRNYERINNALRKREYSLVSNLFEVVGDEDKVFLFENIDRIFSINMILSADSEKFFKELKEIVKKILTYKKFDIDTKKKMRNFVTLMTVLANYNGENEEENESWRKSLIKLFGTDIEIVIDNMIEYCYENDEFDKESIYDCISLIVLETKFRDEESEDINGNLLKTIKGIFPIKAMSIKEEIENITLQKPKIIEALDLESNFKVDIKKTIYVKNGQLIIEKFNLKIAVPITGETKLNRLFLKVLESPNYCLSRNDFDKILNNKKYKGDDNIVYRVKYEVINKINKLVKEELEKNNMETMNFFEIDFEKNRTGSTPIKVKQEFFI